MNVNSRVVAITGASAGIGRATAMRLVRSGAAIVARALEGSKMHVSVVFPVPTETEFFDVMVRESGSATRAAGPRQHADEVANAIARTIAHPIPEVCPYRKARGLVLLNAIAPGVCDRFVKRFGREPVAP